MRRQGWLRWQGNLRAHPCLPNEEIALVFTKRWSLTNGQGFSICQALTFGQAPSVGEH